MNFSVVILAGGKSSRMGRDKAWLEHRGQPLIARQIETVRQLQPAAIFISARTTVDCAGLGCPVLLDNFPGQGPLAGIDKALEVMLSPMLLVLAVDMPHVTSVVLGDLAAYGREDAGAIPRFAGRIEPLAAFYPKAAQRTLQALLTQGLNTATRFAETCVKLGLARFCDLPQSQRTAFANWNSPADLPASLRPAALRVAHFREPDSVPPVPGYPGE
jgi:molybdopterin-guanine dinucleotide biosynthesis protein A